jgi:hypothetical protein
MFVFSLLFIEFFYEGHIRFLIFSFYIIIDANALEFIHMNVHP